MTILVNTVPQRLCQGWELQPLYSRAKFDLWTHSPYPDYPPGFQRLLTEQHYAAVPLLPEGVSVEMSNEKLTEEEHQDPLGWKMQYTVTYMAPETTGYKVKSPMSSAVHGTSLAQEPTFKCPQVVYGSRPVPWPHLQSNVVNDQHNSIWLLFNINWCLIPTQLYLYFVYGVWYND